MRRPRPHRLTGSVRRMLAAAALTGLAAALAMTASSRPASAAGVDVTVDLGVLDVTLPVGLPPVSPLPSVLSLPPLLPTQHSARRRPRRRRPFPGSGGVPALCPPVCVAPSSPGAGGTAVGGSPTTVGPGPQAGSTARPGPAPGGGSAHHQRGSAGTRHGWRAPRSVGLSVSPPPPVEQLTPLAGISFGQAPYLWPLLVLLDLLAAAAVVLLVRRTWSTASDTD